MEDLPDLNKFGKTLPKYLKKKIDLNISSYTSFLKLGKLVPSRDCLIHEIHLCTYSIFPG